MQLLYNIPLYKYTAYFYPFILFLIYLSFFKNFFAITNKILVNTQIHVTLWTCARVFLGGYLIIITLIVLPLKIKSEMY